MTSRHFCGQSLRLIDSDRALTLEITRTRMLLFATSGLFGIVSWPLDGSQAHESKFEKLRSWQSSVSFRAAVGSWMFTAI